MTNQTITRAKGAGGEHTVDVKDIRVEDLWHIAQALKDPGSLRILATQKDMAFQCGESIISVWHLCHDLLRHIKDNQG